MSYYRRASTIAIAPTAFAQEEPAQSNSSGQSNAVTVIQSNSTAQSNNAEVIQGNTSDQSHYAAPHRH